MAEDLTISRSHWTNMIGGNMIMYTSTRLQAADEVLFRHQFNKPTTINRPSGFEFELAYISQYPAMAVKLLSGFKMNN
jgi:hypothetical protein